MNAFQQASPDQVGLFTITDVTFRTVNKRDGTQFTIYETQTAEQIAPFTTSKREIAESAMSLKGQQTEMHYAVKQNGNFTNYYLNAVLPAPVSPVEQAQRAQGAPAILTQAVGSQSLTQPQNTSQPIQQSTVSEWEIQKQASIHRQTAAKVAAVLHAENDSASDLWHNIELLTRYFDTGVLPINDPAGDDGQDIPF